MLSTLNIHNVICQLYLNKDKLQNIALHELNYEIKTQSIRTKLSNITLRRQNKLQVSKISDNLNLQLPRGKGGTDKLVDWDRHIHTIICKMDN